MREHIKDMVTEFPSSIKIAASFDPELAREWADAIGEEFHAKGANVVLGPGLNVNRIPRNGRNFEYLSGEDPFLGYTLAKPIVEAIQSHKLIATAKHFIGNS